jgi:DhnA family fructose-bisphosphate aldolase class Ia
MNGLEYRLAEFIHPSDHHSLIVDTSAGLVLGPLPGLEDYASAVRPVLSIADGVVCGAGQLRRLEKRSMHEAGLLLRMDWSNTLRGPGFVLPPEENLQVQLFSAQDALDFGVVAMVSTFLLGYEEEIEAACMKRTVNLAVEGKPIGMPLVVEVRPDGPRVSLPGKAVELGASYALEGGADVIVIPHPGPASLKTIAEFVSVPWLVKPSSLNTAAAELESALSLGGCGLWLDHTLFGLPHPATDYLAPVRAALHPLIVTER